MQHASAGTFESNDCLITVSHSDSNVIEIDSIVYETFGDQIHQVILSVLQSYHLDHVHVMIKDKGALDYCIKARLITALERLGVIHA